MIRRAARLATVAIWPLAHKLVRSADSAFRLFMAVVLVTAQLTLGAGGASADTAPAGDPRAFQQTMKKYFDALDVIAESYDARVFSVKGQTEILDKDPEKIVAFVTNDIGFEPYVGSLRGPLGALLSRSGNALDQARLLAAMLAEADYEVRIAASPANAELNASLRTQFFENSPKMLAQMVKGGMADKLAEVLQISKDDIAKRLAEFEQNQKAGNDEFVKRVDRWEAALSSALGTLPDKQFQPPKLLFDDTHYWVEFRKSKSDGLWKSADATAALPSGERTAKKTYPPGKLPKSVFHTFGIALTIRLAQKGRKAEDTILVELQVRTADLYGKSVRVAVAPFDLQTIVTANDVDAALAKANDYIAAISLDGGTIAATRYFDLDGGLFDSPPGSPIRNAANQKKTLSEGLGSIGGALGGIFGGNPANKPKPSAKKSIVGLWVDYSLQAPGKKKGLHRRNLLSPVVPVGWKNGQVVVRNSMWTKAQVQSRLIWQVELYPTSAVTPVGYTAHRTLTAARALKGPMLEFSASLFRHSSTDQELTAVLRSIPAKLAAASPERAMHLATMAAAHFAEVLRVSNANLRLYRPNAGLVAYEMRNFNTKDGALGTMMGFDIISIPARPISPYVADNNMLAKLTYFQGVVWTAAENALSASLPVDPSYTNPDLVAPVSSNAGTALETALSDSRSRIVVIRADSDWRRDFDNSDAEPAIKAATARDLAAGFDLVVPESADKAPTTWWKYDATSGVILGVDLEGRGQAEVEYGVALTVGGFVGSVTFVGCLVKKGYSYKIKGSPLASSPVRTIADCFGHGLFTGLAAAGTVIGIFAGSVFWGVTGGMGVVWNWYSM